MGPTRTTLDRRIRGAKEGLLYPFPLKVGLAYWNIPIWYLTTPAVRIVMTAWAAWMACPPVEERGREKEREQQQQQQQLAPKPQKNPDVPDCI